MQTGNVCDFKGQSRAKKSAIKCAYWTVFAIVCACELIHTHAQTNIGSMQTPPQM